MNKICTTIEQSKKLIELGVNVNTADMYYEEVCNLPKAIVGNYILHNQCMEDKDYKKLSHPVLSPAWSLAALSEFILPYIGDDDGNNYKFYLSKDDIDRWIAYYKSDDVSIYICEESDNMIDVILEMVCWLKKEEYI